MSKISLATILLSVILSGLGSFGVSVAYSRLHPIVVKAETPLQTDVIRAKKIELVDSRGNVRAAFELSPNPYGESLPRFRMNNNDGGDAIKIDVDDQGFGSISFSNDHFPEGAVMLGYLGSGSDFDAGREQNRQTAREYGLWGLDVRGPKDGKHSGVYFVNTGRAIGPLPTDPSTAPARLAH